MGKNDSTTNMTIGNPEILTESRRKSWSNPFKSFTQFKAGEAAKLPTVTPNPSSVPATSTLEQETLSDMLRATQGMSPEEVKAFLARKAQADEQKYKNDGSVGTLYWNKNPVGNQQT